MKQINVLSEQLAETSNNENKDQVEPEYLHVEMCSVPGVQAETDES